MADHRRAGFQGALGAFSEEAVLALDPRAEPIPRTSFDAVVRAVERGEDDLGVIPVENTLAGTVVEAFDALASADVRAVAETAIPIRHYLLGTPGASVQVIREVRSHPVALAQCRAFFASHPGIRAQAVYDTAGAAEAVAELADPTVAAIASQRAGGRYGLDVLARDLQDRDDNQTRFYLVASRSPTEAVEDISTLDGLRGAPTDARDAASTVLKTSLIVELENRAGSLHGLLEIFARRELSLTHITSRPAPTPWTYRFIVELLHDSPEEGSAAVDEAGVLATELRVLGTFPAWRKEQEGPKDQAARDDQAARAHPRRRGLGRRPRQG